MKPTPPVTRALLETKAALEAAGHTVIQWEPYDMAKSAQIINKLFTGDGGAKIASSIALSGEDWPLGLAGFAAAHLKTRDNPPIVGDLWTVQAERVSYCKNMLDKWMASAALTGTGRPIDGLLTPTTAFSACPQ